jgi:hypothetical protein
MKFTINKKNNRVLQYILPFMVMVTMLLSCTKFLEEKPTANLTSDYTFTTASEGDALVVGGYRALPNAYTGGAGDYGNMLPAVLEYWTGKAWSAGSHPMVISFQTNQLAGSTLSDFDNYWNNNYLGVKDCNNAIQRINGIIEYSSDQKSSKMAEVRALRALYYFNLVRYFGDVVLDTALSSYLPADAQKPRISLKRIYDEIIIPDLEFAVNSKLANTQSNGSMSKYSAKAILADVYLTCAGYPYQEVATDPTKPWCTTGAFSQQTYPVVSASAASFLAKAKSQLDDLYGKYTLATAYSDLRNPANNNKGENIFQVQFASGIVMMRDFIGTMLAPAARCAEMNEYGTLIPTKAYYNSYGGNDLRAKDRQYFYFSDNVLSRYDPAKPLVKFDQAFVCKYYDESIKNSPGNSGLNFTIYRYTDILLMLTEVNWALQQNGVSVPDADVLKGINAVRSRATLPALGINEINNLTIFSERAWELVFENKMIWDQRRSRKCLIDGFGSFGIENFIGHQPTEFNFKFTAMNLLAPISQAEIANNANCLQNFTYLPKQSGQ